MTTSSSQSWQIPKWFVGVTTSILTLAIPWGGFLMQQVYTLSVEVHTISVRVEGFALLTQQFAQLQSEYTNHIRDPDIHHAGMKSLIYRVERLEKVVDRLEQQAKPGRPPDM